MYVVGTRNDVLDKHVYLDKFGTPKQNIED